MLHSTNIFHRAISFVANITPIITAVVIRKCYDRRQKVKTVAHADRDNRKSWSWEDQNRNNPLPPPAEHVRHDGDGGSVITEPTKVRGDGDGVILIVEKETPAPLFAARPPSAAPVIERLNVVDAVALDRKFEPAAAPPASAAVEESYPLQTMGVSSEHIYSEIPDSTFTKFSSSHAAPPPASPVKPLPSPTPSSTPSTVSSLIPPSPTPTPSPAVEVSSATLLRSILSNGGGNARTGTRKKGGKKGGKVRKSCNVLSMHNALCTCI